MESREENTSWYLTVNGNRVEVTEEVYRAYRFENNRVHKLLPYPRDQPCAGCQRRLDGGNAGKLNHVPLPDLRQQFLWHRFLFFAPDQCRRQRERYLHLLRPAPGLRL